MHDTWGNEQGFTYGSVSSFAQTPDGYLWIGTDAGLIRFDGLSFSKVEQPNTSSYSIGPVQKLLTDRHGNLWILLQNTKLLRYRDGMFAVSPGESENGVTAIGRTTAGDALVSSSAMGTLTYNGDQFVTVSSEPVFADPATLAQGQTPDDRSTRLSWSTSLTPHRLAAPTSAVTSMEATSDGKIWLGTQHGGLFYLSEGRIIAANGGRDLKINCLLAPQLSELLIATNRGVMRWDGNNVTRVGIPTALLNIEVLSILRDRDSNIWVGTAQGLLRYNSSGTSWFSRNTGGHAPVTALFEDREGNIWLGHRGQIERIRDSAFITYPIRALNLQSTGAMYVDNNDSTWFAPIEGGLHWLKAGKHGTVTTAGLSNEIIYSIAGNGKDELWIGRQRGGLTQLRYQKGVFTAKTYRQADGLPQNSVYAVHESKDGTVWSGTLSGGVSELKNGHFKNHTTADGLAANTISSIAESSDGTIWFGTPKGVSALSDKHWRTYTSGNGLLSEDVNCLLNDSTGVLWIGTAQGLAYLIAEQVHIPHALPDSLRTPIFGIGEDANGWLWIATASKVIQVNRSSLMADALTEADVREYGIANGLRGTEGVKRYQSVVKDAHGNIWFSTNRGLSMVNPARATVSLIPALLHIEAVLDNGNPIDLRRALRVSAKQHKTTFRFMALNFANSGRVRYRYRLDGFDHDWSDPTANHEATYANLGPGSYRFRVVASNGDGQWNGSEAAIGLEVEPTLWQTWWFRSAVVLCAGLAVLSVYLMRMHQVTTVLNARFEERLAERARIAQDLHDTLLQGVVSASMQLHVLADQLPSGSPSLREINRVLHTMQQVIEEGRNTLRGLRSSIDAAKDLQNSFSRIPQELSKNAAGFRVFVEGKALPVRSAVRDDIYRIGREALVNAFRHSGAININLYLEYTVSHLRILVQDDGCGVDPQVLQLGREGHWGLRGMHERAERIGARLRILSRAGAGTEVELRIPSDIAFESHTQKSASKLLTRLPWWSHDNERVSREQIG
jgi:signal transduction histidine kinase/ligand-binding sensor domain-containing protein